MRVWMIAAVALLFSTSVAGEQHQECTEVNDTHGLTVEITFDALTVKPESPCIRHHAIREPIPVFVDTQVWTSITFGGFELQPETASPAWAQMKNAASLVSGAKVMIGAAFGLGPKTPGLLRLHYLLRPADLTAIEAYFKGGNTSTRLVKFVITVEDSDGQRKHVDPGIGVLP